MCGDDTEQVLLHQDVFAADYQEDEYTLLSMAIKFAGLRGKEVRVMGKNRLLLEVSFVEAALASSHRHLHCAKEMPLSPAILLPFI
jgi:hypothetical protein